ncbi:MAG: DUF5309 family protein, partial [Phycisphaeraceae bacterium]
MGFTGKATYSAGATLPEIAEDVSDIIGIVSPYETPLLDHLGDSHRVATSTRHEWLEDELLPNVDAIDAAHTFSNPITDSTFDVVNSSRFRVGDQLQGEGSLEVMLVTDVSGDTLTVVRGYGATTADVLYAEQEIRILGNAALEGADRPETRFTTRTRATNHTQIFTSAVEVSGTQLAVNQIGVNDELDYQKQERLRELVRDLENCVINGVAPADTQQGSASVRRTMRGITSFLDTNVFRPGQDAFPDDVNLTEVQLNQALRRMWEQSSGGVDTIVVGGVQKRRINSFITSSRQYGSEDSTYRDLVSTYESDFGVCRVVLSRWMPAHAVLLLDSSRIDVMPLAGRHFHYKPLASGGDREVGQVIGEYTL